MTKTAEPVLKSDSVVCGFVDLVYVAQPSVITVSVR
ncbi:hypothetical protein SAMN05216597_3149 [Pseudomonas cannabina]|nr:hypothetical protein SAMN05216597_3149 [Pseudomonas cannabina]